MHGVCARLANGRGAGYFNLMTDGLKSSGIVALAASGAGAAFALAACCAVPALLISVGVGTAWVAPIASASQPHSDALTGVSAFALMASVGAVARAPRTCKPGAICARGWFRWSIVAVAFAGAALLMLSSIYG